MAEGLSATEVGKELGEHARHAEHAAASGHLRLISIAEAIVLSIVAIIAAWSGFAAAKWGTESSLTLAKASATRSKANRDYSQALTFRAADASMFNAWFGAYIAGKPRAAAVAAKRFRPEYRVAFDAWLATHPFTNPNAPPGPQSMPQYKPTGQAESVVLDHTADEQYAEGEKAARNSDDYVRTTVILASVLFLIGISSHFPVKGVRIGLISVGVALLLFAAIDILSLPRPP
jgi:hypothetical protein